MPPSQGFSGGGLRRPYPGWLRGGGRLRLLLRFSFCGLLFFAIPYHAAVGSDLGVGSSYLGLEPVVLVVLAGAGLAGAGLGSAGLAGLAEAPWPLWPRATFLI